jgi:hypothetical protein
VILIVRDWTSFFYLKIFTQAWTKLSTRESSYPRGFLLSAATL